MSGLEFAACVLGACVLLAVALAVGIRQVRDGFEESESRDLDALW